MYSKDFEGWNKRKQRIHYEDTELGLFFKQREIWWASLGVNIGSEIDGKNVDFERPILVLRKVSNNTAFVVPMTSKTRSDTDDRHAFMHNGEWYNLILSQSRLISTKRFIRKVGTIEDNTFDIAISIFIVWLTKKRFPLISERDLGAQRPQ